MADDINKKISIDVEVNTDGQQQINQYKAAFDNLRSSISALSSPLSGLSNNIASLDKDLSKLAGSIDKLNKQNQDMASSGVKTDNVVTDLITSFTTWTRVMEILKITVGGFETALTGGLSVLTVFLPEIIKWVGELFKGNTTLSALNKTLKDNKIVIDAINQARAQGKDDAQQELVQVKLLYKASQDHNLSLTERKKIVSQLQSQYPDYFGNISAETILAGKAAKSYDSLTKAIIATSRAKAAEAIITKNEIRQLGNDTRIQKSQSDLANYTKQLQAVQKDYDDYMKTRVIGGGSAGYVDSEESDLYRKLAGIRDQVNGVKKSLSDLGTDSDLLNKQNEALAKTVLTDTEKNGAGVLGTVTNTTKKLIANTGTAINTQQSFNTEAEKIRNDSLNRQLQTTYDAYGTETLAENNHYQDELNRLKKLLSDKKITRDEYNKVSAQLQNEHHDNLAAIINKYNGQDKERTEQAQNELAELRIKGMQEGSAKQITELQQEQTEKTGQMDKVEQESVERIKKLYQEINNAKAADPKADTSQLQNQLNNEYAIQDINCQKRIALEQQTANAIKKIKDDEAQTGTIKKDQQQVDTAKDPEAKLAAEKKMITDKYQFEIEQAQGNAVAIEKIKADLNTALAALDKNYQTKKDTAAKAHQKQVTDEVIKDAKQLADQALSFVTNSIKQQTNAKIAALEKDKSAELNNSSLTSAQKLAIEQKYKQQEGQIKAKAFKEEQEASIAQAVINGALAVTKIAAQAGVLAPLEIGVTIAETAAQIAKIAAQKAPAYAKGGLHYSSDGRGGVLSGYSRTDNTNAYLRSGEAIVVSEAMQVPWARNLVSAINVGFGGRDFSVTNPGRGYAVGGIFTDGGDANRYYNAPVTDQKNLANTIAYQMINNFPPVYVDVKDVNNQQNILAQTVNRVNL